MKKEQNVVSDAAEKKLAAKILKEEQQRQFAGVDGKGISIASMPIIPVGSSIFLEWNIDDKESKLIGIDNKSRKALNPWWTVVGIGGNVKTVTLGDRIILKEDVEVNSFITDDLQALNIPTLKYHVIFEHNIFAIIK